MCNYDLSIRSFGRHAILIEWPNEVKEIILDDILRFTHHLKTSCLNMSRWEVVPAYNSITLVLREKPIVFNALKQQLYEWYAASAKVQARPKFLWRLPVCYDLDFGIDLNFVAEKLERPIAEIIHEHTQHVYTVYGIGFLPGFMYLGGLPKGLEVARKTSPRMRVLKGAVGLAGKQTGIYPQESPGGWNIIGNCAVPLFNAAAENPCFVSVGDKVQFYQIERAEHDLHTIEGEVGIYKLEKTEWNA